MSLLDYYLNNTCALMEKKRTPDGEGGWATEWAQGAEFDAAIILDTSMQSVSYTHLTLPTNSLV